MGRVHRRGAIVRDRVLVKSSRYAVNCVAAWTDTPQARDLKHLALHVAKKAGKLAALAEDMDHAPVGPERMKKLDEADIPDLVILAATLADARNLNLNAAVERRGRELTER